MLTDKQVQKIIKAVAEYHAKDGDDGPGYFTEDEVTKVVRWIEGVMIDHGMMLNVLNGRFSVAIDKDGEVSFRITPKGERYVESLPLKEASA